MVDHYLQLTNRTLFYDASSDVFFNGLWIFFYCLCECHIYLDRISVIFYLVFILEYLLIRGHKWINTTIWKCIHKTSLCFISLVKEVCEI